MAEVSCEGDCFTINGPNLIPSSTIDANEDNPLVVDRCGDLRFPAGSFTVSNPNLREGTKDAVTRGDEQLHGFYLTNEYTANGEPVIREEMKIGQFSAPEEVGGQQLVSNGWDCVPNEAEDCSLVLDIPAWVEDGSSTLVFFADQPLKVSEYDEPNNDDVRIPVLVTGSGTSEYVFVGSPPLVDGMISSANAGSVVPLSWKYFDPEIDQFIDSSGADPVVSFEGWTGEGVDCSNYIPEDPDERTEPDISFSREEDPGSSDLRYISGGWQFNWQTKVPDGEFDSTVELTPGDPLPQGCYEITISSAYTCGTQGDGPFLVQLN